MAGKVDRTVWMLRSEAAELLGVTTRTLRRWEGPRLRTMVIQQGKLPVAFVLRSDVERLRVARVGIPVYQIESAVLAALLSGESPEIIVREHHVSLADVERIRAHFVRLKDAWIVEASDARKMREALGTERLDAGLIVGALCALREMETMLGVGDADHVTLVAAVRALVDRVARLAAERRISPIQPVLRSAESASEKVGRRKEDRNAK